MGLSSSAVRFLQLTTRKNTISNVLASLAADKLSLTREMRKISREYNDSLNAKVFKWSSNSGVTYQDLSYKNLMQPGIMNSGLNNNTAYLLTDMNGRVVLDDRYRQYAEMISPDGSEGGDWLSNRTAILSKFTGIDAEKIENVAANDAIINESKAQLKQIENEKPSANSFKSNDFSILLEKMGNTTGASNGASFEGADGWADAYRHARGTINLGSGNNAGNVLESICDNLSDSLSKYLVSEKDLLNPDAELPFAKACDDFKRTFCDNFNAENINDGNSVLTKEDDGDIILDVNIMLNYIMDLCYTGPSTSGVNGSSNYTWYDLDTTQFSDYESKYNSWKTDYDAALLTYETASSNSSAVLTASEESLINFYDNLFGTIAEKGWVYNANVSDDNYLNEMLQNNMFTITTVNREDEGKGYSEDYYAKATYNTEVAKNMTNIFEVNDTTAREDAYIEYEEKKAIINEKETQIDLRSENLKLEEESINNMLQSMKTIMDDNIERFSVFT